MVMASLNSTSQDALHFVVTVTPAPGMRQRIEELLRKFVEVVEKNEPDTLQCELFESEETGELYFVETYKNQAALDYHKSAEHHREIERAIKDQLQALSKPMEIRCMKKLAGFTARDASSAEVKV